MIFDWFVLGAGPAGIAAIGQLLDRGVENIGWMDPQFTVGDLGAKWSAVESNTRVSLFLQFLHAFKAFRFADRPSQFPIELLNPKDTCRIECIVQPLQWITDHLIQQVHSFRALATDLVFKENVWQINSTYKAKNVILAIGADSKMIPHQAGEIISLDVALQPEKLSKAVGIHDTIAVFGGSHSAVLAIANLLQCKVRKVINFYRSPYRYAVYFDDWILYDNTGLKGATAQWARENLDASMPPNLKRILISDPDFEKELALCNKTIYALGFERRILPSLGANLDHDQAMGIIAPGLFGLGIAYPEMKIDRAGNLEMRVGLWKFIEHLTTVFPAWRKSSQTARLTSPFG